MTFSFCRCRL